MVKFEIAMYQHGAVYKFFQHKFFLLPEFCAYGNCVNFTVYSIRVITDNFMLVFWLNMNCIFHCMC